MTRGAARSLRIFRDLPIRQKLVSVVILTTAAALLLSGAGIVLADFLLFRNYLKRDLSTLASIIGDNSTASLEFNEPQSAQETLAALRERSHIIATCVYRIDGTVLASYTRAGSAAQTGSNSVCPPPAKNYQVRWEREVIVSEPIVLRGKQIGTLLLRYDLGEIQERVWLFGTTVLSVLLVSSLAAFLLSSGLRESIAKPISRLAETTKSVAATKDYSIRAHRHSRDELGLLVDGFNEMLSGIQSRDIDLIKALTAREDALGEARSTRDFLRTTLASIADAVLSTDNSGRIVFANPVALTLLQQTESEATGKPVDDLFRVADQVNREPIESAVAKALREAKPVGTSDPAILMMADGSGIPIDYSAAPICNESGDVVGAVLVFRDITERQKAEQERERLVEEKLAAEERLRQSAKLDSLGVLAGGIAHDFNNLLVGIMGNASLVETLLPPSSRLLPLIHEVVGASEKAAQLTHQMLAYSGKGRFIIDLVDLSVEVREILPLISRPIPKSVSVHMDLEADLPAIEADKSQIQRILMNLVINAAEACGGQPGSVLIKTYRAERDARSVPPAFGLKPIEPGTYVCLEIKDTGSGMSDEVKAKIFDPFFTTKFTGRGLGLSAVLGIIRAHKGTIEVESAPHAGTTFRVFFPSAEGRPETDDDAPVDVRQSRGTGTVLVVDDEEFVRSAAKSALETCGYQVILAEDGDIGVRTFVEFADRVSIIILDLTMPVMDGEATLAQIRRINPAVKVILSSGFDRLEIAERFRGKGLVGFLQKPYTASRLTQAVNAALQNGDRASVQT